MMKQKTKPHRTKRLLVALLIGTASLALLCFIPELLFPDVTDKFLVSAGLFLLAALNLLLVISLTKPVRVDVLTDGENPVYEKRKRTDRYRDFPVVLFFIVAIFGLFSLGGGFADLIRHLL